MSFTCAAAKSAAANPVILLPDDFFSQPKQIDHHKAAADYGDAVRNAKMMESRPVFITARLH
jgi:hypothetical protein